MQLADFGARVIKIERNKYGDQSRYWAPINEAGESGYYEAINRGKESITLNIGTPEGLEIAKKLIAKADIMLENFSVGSMEKKGLGYEAVKEINPEIIYGSISGYGQNTTWRKLPAYDNVIQAQTGLMEMTGTADGVPTKVGVSVGDNYTGLEMSLAVALAYYHKLKTGKGQYIDIAMYDTLFEIQEGPILTWELEGVKSTRCGNTDPTLFPYDVYPCKDGYFSPGVAAGSKKEWRAFCEAIEMPELLENERWMSNDNRIEDYDELTAKVLPFFAERTKAELKEIFNAHKIPNAPVNTIPELLEDPQLEAREMLVELDSPAIGKYKATGNPMKMSMTPPVVDRPAPLLGQHTDAVVAELGYSAEEIAALHESGVL